MDEKIIGFDENALAYSERFGDVSSYAPYLSSFASMLEKSGRLLDLACGPGNTGAFIQTLRKDISIEGVDASPAMIELARKNIPGGVFHIGDIRTFPVRENCYSGIICAFGLPFLSRQESSFLLNTICRTLKPGGAAYISTMMGSSEGFEKTSFSGPREIYFIYHDRPILEESIIHSGLEIVEYHESLFHQDTGPDLIDMIFIARKKG